MKKTITHQINEILDDFVKTESNPDCLIIIGKIREKISEMKHEEDANYSHFFNRGFFYNKNNIQPYKETYNDFFETL